MSDHDQGAGWDRIERRGPDNFFVRGIRTAEAMQHLDPAGAYAAIDPADSEAVAMQAALDMIGALRDPPVQGEAARRAALRDYLVDRGYLPPVPPSRRP